MDSILVGKYEGEYQNGLYHDGVYKGYWVEGKLVNGCYVYSDGLEHKKVTHRAWDYCSNNDPRFYTEIKDGIKNGDELRDTTAHDYGHLTPKDCFDTIDGYYDVLKHAVFDYKTGEIVRTPNQTEIDWIIANCRVGKGFAVN
eukprot:gene23411-26502_t